MKEMDADHLYGRSDYSGKETGGIPNPHLTKYFHLLRQETQAETAWNTLHLCTPV